MIHHPPPVSAARLYLRQLYHARGLDRLVVETQLPGRLLTDFMVGIVQPDARQRVVLEQTLGIDRASWGRVA